MKTILVILQELVQQYYHRLLYGAKKDDLKLSGIEIEGLAEVRAEKWSVDSNNVSEKHDK